MFLQDAVDLICGEATRGVSISVATVASVARIRIAIVFSRGIRGCIRNIGVARGGIRGGIIFCPAATCFWLIFAVFVLGGISGIISGQFSE
jgi:hypothetical protein